MGVEAAAEVAEVAAAGDVDTDTTAASTAKKGLCTELGTNVFDYGTKNVKRAQHARVGPILDEPLWDIVSGLPQKLPRDSCAVKDVFQRSSPGVAACD